MPIYNLHVDVAVIDRGEQANQAVPQVEGGVRGSGYNELEG
jgi:hypothetical protein